MSFRIGSTVLVDCGGSAIQSYGFRFKRSLGNLRQVLKFLDQYEVDEVHVIIPSKGERKCDSLQIFSDLSNVSISTPLGIGGGLTMLNIDQITQDPFFERCIFNSAIFTDSNLIDYTRAKMGHQSMVASIPFLIDGNVLLIYNSKYDKFQSVDGEFWNRLEESFNEVILLDAASEGNKQGFNFESLKYIDFPTDRILISGGLVREDIVMAKAMNLAGVSIDNFTLHSEYSIKGLR